MSSARVLQQAGFDQRYICCRSHREAQLAVPAPAQLEIYWYIQVLPRLLLLSLLAASHAAALLRPLAPHLAKACMRVSIGCQPSLPRRSEIL
jgi:hypothetical protein